MVILHILAASLLLASGSLHDDVVQNGDRVVFLGDGTTDQRIYTSLLESYFTGRYPDYELTFVHSGAGGDTVRSALARVNRDVISAKPTLVTIALGTNDVASAPKDEPLVEWFIRNYSELVDTLQEQDIRLILIGPNPVDVDYSVNRDPRDLKAVSDALMEFAAEQKVKAVDMFHPMSDLLRKSKELPTELVLMPGGVNPSPAGHLAMAYMILTSLKAPAVVAEISIDAKTGTVNSVGTAVSQLSTEDVVEFTAIDSALPMHIPDDAQSVFAIAPVQQDLNRHILKITGLPATRYEVLIDNISIARFSNTELEAGVNLSDYPTPAWNQAARLWRLIQTKNDTYNHRMRQVLLYRAPDWLSAEIVEPRRKRALDEIDARIAQMEDRISEEKMPVAHHFAIKKAN